MQKTYFDYENENRPYIAVNGVVYKKINNKTYILLGKRKNVSGAGFYYLPGGHIHNGESIEQALIRELKEECGLDVKKGNLLWVEESLLERHHIIFYYEAFVERNIEPVNLDPDRCYGWKWFALDNPPSPLWRSLSQFINEQIKKQRILRFAKPSVDYVGGRCSSGNNQ